MPFPPALPPTTPGEEPGAGDHALLARLRRGDDDAFASVVNDYGPQLLAVARRMLGNDEDAHDALQDSFLSAFRAVEDFEGKSRLSTWLHRVTVNAALMKLRSRKRRREHTFEDLLPRFTDDGHHADPPCPFSDAAVKALHSQESRAMLWRALDQLPAPYREVIVLRDIETISTEEAAHLLGITPNATKIRLHRARQALRTLLGNDDEVLP